jgi:hypothetical protein
MSGPYVVILTGGALPGQDHGTPEGYQVDLALQHAGCASGDKMGRHVAGKAWRLGYAEAAKLHRVVAVYVLDDADDARRFAEFVTREIDPAYVKTAVSPLGELFAVAEELRRRDQVAAGGAA